MRVLITVLAVALIVGTFLFYEELGGIRNLKNHTAGELFRMLFKNIRYAIAAMIGFFIVAVVAFLIYDYGPGMVAGVWDSLLAPPFEFIWPYVSSAYDWLNLTAIATVIALLILLEIVLGIIELNQTARLTLEEERKQTALLGILVNKSNEDES
jgi:hypothetical protein